MRRVPVMSSGPTDCSTSPPIPAPSGLPTEDEGGSLFPSLPAPSESSTEDNGSGGYTS